MFVRFRATKTTLQVSLLEGRRVNGPVRHEQVAALGSIKLPLTVRGREVFWRRLHETLARLGNRISVEVQAKIMGAVHGRIPLVTMDELREYEIALAEEGQRFWGSFQDMLIEHARGRDGIARQAAAEATEDRAAASDAGEWARAAADRAERLRRGEDVPRGREIDADERVAALRWLRELCGG